MEVTPICNNTSVGIVVRDEKQRILLLERKKFPPGFASPAGHVDDQETCTNAAIRELKEETGLDVLNIQLVLEIDMNNKCRRINGSWHHWCVYQAIVKGELIRNIDEAKQIGWYTIDEVKNLGHKTEEYLLGNISDEIWQQFPGLEPVWYDFFKKLSLI